MRIEPRTPAGWDTYATDGDIFVTPPSGIEESLTADAARRFAARLVELAELIGGTP